MKLLQFSAGSSDSGKTVTSMIIIRALKNMGYDVQGFKCGPDFIDSKYLALACGKKSANLDVYLMGEEGLRNSLKLSKAEIGILEGAMGYFDGIGITKEASAYHIAQELNINTILIYQPKGEMHTIVPKLKGMVNYSRGRIKGVIFSNTTERMYGLLQKMMKKHSNIKVLGYIENNESMELKSRNLGLYSPDEMENISEKLDFAADKSMETVNYKGILKLMTGLKVENSIQYTGTKPTVGIARDKAFSFLYGENISLLKKYFNVRYFSPLKDLDLPNCDFIFIPGGYPENYLDELSTNISMRDSIRQYVNNGGYLYAEGGGLMYMAESIENIPMCGVLPGNVFMEKGLQNFGYVQVKTLEDSILGREGMSFHAHEFHYSRIETLCEPIFLVKKARGGEPCKSGYKIKNALMSYQHINFCGNEKLLKRISEKIGGKHVSE